MKKETANTYKVANFVHLWKKLIGSGTIHLVQFKALSQPHYIL